METKIPNRNNKKWLQICLHQSQFQLPDVIDPDRSELWSDWYAPETYGSLELGPKLSRIRLLQLQVTLTLKNI